MSLMDLLLNEPSAQDRYAQAQQMMGGLTSLRPPGSPGGDVGGFTAGEGGGHEAAIDIARWIENRPGDFQVGELEGWNGQGPISSGHVENSQHYTGEAGDVNYYGGPRFDNEDAALTWLYGKMENRFGPELTELLWHVPDHYDHLHYGTRPGG